MAWITTTYIDNLITSQTREAVVDAAAFTQIEIQARSRVTAVIMYAGYPDPGATTTNAALQDYCAAVWVEIAYAGRKGLELPESVKQSLGMLQAVYDKRLPVPGLSLSDASDGRGGVQASSASETADAGRPPRMKRSDLRRW